MMAGSKTTSTRAQRTFATSAKSPKSVRQAPDGPNVTHGFHKLLKRRATTDALPRPTPRVRVTATCPGGVHPRVVITLGHCQISLTMNTYSHVLPVLQREAADRMEAVLSVT
jgi:hypothetical protein